MTLMSSDTLQRSNQSGWGTASDGEAWTEIGTGTVSIANNEGVIVSHGVDTNMRLGTNNAADVEMLVRFSINLTNDIVGVQGRFTAAGGLTTCYKFLYYTGAVHLNKSVSGTLTTDLTTAVSFSVTNNTYYWLRFRIQGTTLSGKIWADGSGEPGSWTITTTDSSVTGAHRVALLGNTDTGSAGVHFDHFTATNLLDTFDIMMRARLTNNQNTKDIMLRARIAGPSTKDIMMRARLSNPTHTDTKDIMLRARVMGLGLKDLMMRACLQEAVTALPSLAASVLTATISGTSYTVLEGSPAYGETLDGRSTCSFIIRDDTGTVHFRFRQKVILTHSVRGVIFTGFINTAQEENLPPNPTNTITITCIDEHWIADKRAYEGTEFTNQNAGSIAAYLASQLASDGITSAYAIDHDTTISDFAEGTLSGVVAVASTSSTLTGDGDLELAPSGTTLTVTEQSTADFTNGTLSNTQANGTGPAGSGSLSLASTPAIKMTGTASIPGGGNLYAYQKIWTGSQALATGYTLHYDVWIASTSPQIQAGVDMIMSDGTSMRDVSSQACRDQQYLPAHPGTDLSGFANDQWYSRTIKLDALNGKTTAYASIAFEGNNVGTYTAYFRNVRILDNNGNLAQTIFNGTLGVSPAQQLSNQGYSNVSVSVVTAYQQTGTRTSPAWALDSVGIARASLISWQTTIPTDPLAKTNGAAYSVAVSASLDGGNTFQPCVNNQPIPGVMPGLLTTGQTLTLLETLSNTTTDPTQTPALNSLQATIQPSYASIKRDVVTKTATSADWNAGTFNAASLYNNGLTLDGYTRTWDSASTSGQTTFGGNGPSVYTSSRQVVVSSLNNADARSRLDFAGQWQNFTAEVDVVVGAFPDAVQNAGLVYRTTGWQNNNDTYAYSAFVNLSQIVLATGTNSSSGSGTYTQLASASLTLSSGNTHRLKVVVNGNTHTVYLDDVQYLNVTDSTYTAAGYIGLRYYNTGGNMFLTAPGLTAGTHYTTITVNYISEPITNATLITIDLGGAHPETVYAYGPQAAATGVTAIQITTNSLGNGAAQATFTPAFNHSTGALTTFPYPGQATFNNFGVAAATSVQRVSPGVDLSSAGTVQDSYISWNATVPGSSSLLVEASVNGGTTWQTCTNGAALGVAPVVPATNPVTNTLPLLTRGTNLAGVSLLVRVTLSTTSVATQPTIADLTTWVVGQLNATGSRISLPLSLSPVGRVGDSLVNWTVTLPNASTTFGIDVSPDGINWTDATASNNLPIPFIQGMQDPPFIDTYSIDNSANYTQGNVTTAGGSTATWSVSTTASEVIATGGVHAFFAPKSEMPGFSGVQLLGDGEIYFDSDRCDAGGVIWSLSSDFGTCYELAIQDSAAPRAANTMHLYKVMAGAYTQLGKGAALSFTRGIPTRFKIVQSAGVITVTTSYPVTTPDGAVVAGNTQTLTYTDTSPLAPGGVALRSSGGTNHYSYFVVRAYGEDETNESLYTRVRLASTDPTSTPQLQDLTVAVHGQTISDGALIPTTTYSTLSGSTNTIAQDLDDLVKQSAATKQSATTTVTVAKQSTFWWRILQGILYFQPTTGTFAPFPVTGSDMLYPAKITVTYNSDLYRNESIIIGGTDVQALVETYIANGFLTAFPTGDPIDSIISVAINGQSQTFGIQGVDTGKNWYYQQGKQGITADPSATPLPNGAQVTIQYEGQIQVIAKARNQGQITLLASIDGTSGVVTVVEQASGLNSAAAQALAVSRISQYATFSITLQFTTCRPGLHIGQLLSITLPQHGLQDVTALITQVQYSEAVTTINGTFTLVEYFQVTCTTGPVVGQWMGMFG